MCVIALVTTEKQRLTKEQIEKMFEANSFGAGAVWINAKDRTQWIKGLDEGAVREMVPNLPLPYAIHFRNPSPNTSISDLACHPFQVNESANCDLQGETDGFMLMHNGYWGNWKDKVIELATKGGWKLPTGPWSDSRALALVAHHLGEGAIELIGEKVLMFSASHIETHGSGWTTVKGHDNLVVSNLTWEATFHRPSGGHGSNTHGSFAGNMYTTPPASMAGGTSGHERRSGSETVTEKTGSTGGSSQVKGFRPSGQEEQAQAQALSADRGSAAARPAFGSVQAGGDQQEAAQPPNAAVGAAGGGNRPFNQSWPEVKAWVNACKDGTVCQDCQKVPGHIKAYGVRRCFGCWDAYMAKEKQGPTMYDTCDYCHEHPSTMITLATAKWICNQCWSKNGRPDACREKDTPKRTWDSIMIKRKLYLDAHSPAVAPV